MMDIKNTYANFFFFTFPNFAYSSNILIFLIPIFMNIYTCIYTPLISL